MLSKISVFFFTVMLMAFFTFTANAAPITFTDEAAFMAAISDFDKHTLDFEGSEVGALIPSGNSLEGIFFSYNLPGENLPEKMVVVDEYLTTSGNNFLGLTMNGKVEGDNYFWDRDEFDLFFDPVHAIGLYFITSDFAIAEEIWLETAGGSAYNSEERLLLEDGGLAYFVGMVSDAPFTSAHIGFAADGESNFTYIVDDITLAASEAFNPVPEPATLLLFGCGLIGLLVFKRGRG